MKKQLLLLIVSMFVGSLYAEDVKNERIRPTEEITSPYFSIQLLALEQYQPDTLYFQHVSKVRQFCCIDGFNRYLVGQYESYEQAMDSLSVYKQKYNDAFVVDTRRLKLSAQIDTVQVAIVKRLNEMKVKTLNQQKETIVEAIADRVIQSKIEEDGIFVIQLSATRFPMSKYSFEGVGDVLEFFMPGDEMYRYTTDRVVGSEVEELLQKVRTLGYHDAIVVEFSLYKNYLTNNN